MQKDSNPLCINIGCGNIAADGWMNIDKSPNARLSRHKVLRSLLYRSKLISESTYRTQYPKNILYRDVHKRGLPIQPGTADWIYSSHLIESMSRDQAKHLLTVIHKALKPGGRLRLVISDLEEQAKEWKVAIDAYFAGQRHHFKDCPEEDLALGDCFMYSMKLTRYGRFHLSSLQRVFDYAIQHHYDFDSLSLLLNQAGFKTVEKSEYRQTDMPDKETLETHLGSLHVEAVKE